MKKIKEWFRAYFNYGLINYIKGNPRLLPREMGRDGFFLDPWGDVLACNGMDEKMPMGNLKEQSWDEIWNSKRAQEVRQAVKDCKKNCWMIGSVAPAMRALLGCNRPPDIPGLCGKLLDKVNIFG